MRSTSTAFMTAVVAARPGIPILGRAAAVLALTAAAVHVLQVSGSSLGSLLLAAMALACLPCGWHLWRSPTPSVWRLTAAVDLGMLLGHGTLMAGASHAMHRVGASGLMWLGIWLVVGQLALAGIVAWTSWMSTRRDAPGPGFTSTDGGPAALGHWPEREFPG